ncbi:MAG: ABC transporter ATP-binding protein [Firmicutes bacterium]|nr:ABC transporter ATP-binding protein [Bacillota bacterium]
MAGEIIRTYDLTKRYGDLTAVDSLNLEIQPGEVFGLLGPNGAGKTTTILMLLGLTEPTAGRAEVCGLDPTREPLAVKRQVGYLPDNVGFYDELTGRQNLRYTAELNGLPREEAERRIEAALEQVGLTAVADRKVATYSRGMRQRLGLADVLLKQPRVAILDEPTLGLDPEAAQEFLVLIRRLSREGGMTVLLSSHLLNQVQAVCDRVGIFVAGRMIACGRIDELAAQVFAGEPLQVEVEVEPASEAVLSAIRQTPGVREAQPAAPGEGPAGRLRLLLDRDVRGEVVRRIVGAGGTVLHLQLRSHNLDEIYRRYFRGGDGDGAAAAAGVARPAG